MSIHIFYALNLLLLLSSLLVFRLRTHERLFSLSLVQALLCLPLQAGEYIYVAQNLGPQLVPLVLFSEAALALLWFYAADRLCRVTVATDPESTLSSSTQILAGTAVVALGSYCLVRPPDIRMSDGIICFEPYGLVHVCALFVLLSTLAAAWRLEEFWRTLAPVRRWEYKFLVVGGYLICGALAWAASYRLTYLRLVPDHLILLAVLLLFAWCLMCYAVARHRLLNRKMFVSRKVVYSFVAPTIFAAYLFALALVSLVMRIFGLPLPYVLQWLGLALGLVAVGLFACSGKLRRRVQFFISTHFYINKYEYRDEWLALSRELQGALSETDVVEALRQVLANSLYTTGIVIWFGNMKHGYRAVVLHGQSGNSSFLAPDDPLVRFLTTHPYFYLEDKAPDREREEVAREKKGILNDLDLVLVVPLLTGDQLVGLIGLGPEFTGGRYGDDDFDLLTALGTQAASALLAVHRTEELAHAREQQAWERLSAFVLHDVKNAATMLSLVRENAPDHIQEPEFQQDMLEVVDNALKRMANVQERLGALKGETAPAWQDLELCPFLKDLCRKLGKKLAGLEIALDCPGAIHVQTDPGLLSPVIENILLNVIEAGGDGPIVRIDAGRDDEERQAVIQIMDNGPGIPQELLPDALFEPFKTTKPKGSGIGLWQVKQLVTGLRGTVSAENPAEGGARFTVRLPLAAEAGGKTIPLDHPTAGH